MSVCIINMRVSDMHIAINKQHMAGVESSGPVAVPYAVPAPTHGVANGEPSKYA